MPCPAMPHLLVDITAHGYGHVSQTAPVVYEPKVMLNYLG